MTSSDHTTFAYSQTEKIMYTSRLSSQVIFTEQAIAISEKFDEYIRF